MRPLVEAGGAVYLPHPRVWNPEYHARLSDFDAADISNELLGLVNAVVLWEDFGVGSFSWHPDFGTIERLAANFVSLEGESERHEVAYALQDLIVHTDALYLQDVDLAAFYNHTRNPVFRQELRLALTALRDRFEGGESTEDRAAAVRELVSQIATGLAQQRKAVRAYWAGRVTAGAGAAGSGLGVAGHLIGIAHDGASALSLMFLLGGTAAAGAAARRLVTTRLSSEIDPLVYQVFGNLEEEARRRRIQEFMEDRL
jgi:hypothetical protein